MKIVRRLFVVPLANNNHGKSTIVRALVAQGLGKAFTKQKKGNRQLVTPWGRIVDAYVFGRSYQEVEKAAHGSVLAALLANDPSWASRELIVMPSHVSHISNAGRPDDIDEMIDISHAAGFDIICVSVHFMGDEDRRPFADIWRKNWDERWTVPNPLLDEPDGQLEALGRDLWTWVSRALAS
nr:hypothetical protein [Mesorhizobium sp.]